LASELQRDRASWEAVLNSIFMRVSGSWDADKLADMLASSGLS
jgi:hypothetical protein